jgi:TolB-like protein
MAPEQLRGEPATITSDVFAAGTVMYEMIAGCRPFSNIDGLLTLEASPVEPPALNEVLQTSLAKQPGLRYASVVEMADALRRFQAQRARSARSAGNLQRLIVLPFQILRKDEDTDFLAFSLADAIASSLSGLKSLVVRSTLMATKFAAEPDVKRIAREADVDYVLTGTLVRFQNDLRITAQLVDATDGSLMRSRTEQVALGNLFALQDQLVRQIVQDLAIQLTAREERMIVRDVPANAEAYELYLRANEIWLDRYQTVAARDLYRRCVELDPEFAPAWARLGRCYRLIGKYGKGSREALAIADAAFRRALELNPDLEAAHGMYAQLEADLGKPTLGMYRILERLRENPNAPDLYAALVYLLRFCGLLQESVQAHERAMQLDPNLPTSVTQTWFYMGDYQQSLAASQLDMVYIDAMAMAMLGRVDEAVSLAKMRLEKPNLPPLFRPYLGSLIALLEGRREDCHASMQEVFDNYFLGPEETLYLMRQLAYLDFPEEALTRLERMVAEGWCAYPMLVHDPWLDGLRGDARFVRLLQSAGAAHAEARAVFSSGGGPELLTTTGSQ